MTVMPNTDDEDSWHRRRARAVNDRLVAHLNRSSRLFMVETRATVLDSGTRIDELFPWNFKTGVDPRTACSRSCHA